MRARGVVVALALSGLLAGCAARPRGAPPGAGDERVRADVGRRTGTEVGPAACGPDAEAAVRALLGAPLTEAAAVKVALLRNPEVREIYERLGIAGAELLQAGLLKNPVFSIDAKSFSGGLEIEAALAQSFVDLFFLPARRRVARAGLRAQEAQVARALVRLIYDVKRAFVRVHAAAAVAALAGDVLTRADASSALMRQLHAAGNALDTVRTVEEAAAARARLDLDAARLAEGEARETLGVLLGLTGGEATWSLASALRDPPPPEPEDVEGRAQRASLDLLESRARIDAYLCQAGLVRREGSLPELSLGVVGKREAADAAWGFGPSLSTALPLFDHGQARLLATHARLRQEVARHEGLTIQVQSAARRLAARRAALTARLRYLREVYLPLRARLVEEGLQFFNAMQIGAFDVLRAKQQELDARREQVETLGEAWLAALDLGELLAGSLNPARLEALNLPHAPEPPVTPKGH